MSHRALQRLVSTALTDQVFCDRLLNGRRRAVLTGFELTDEEQATVLSIEAGSLQEFAIQLDEWLQPYLSLAGRP